MTGWCLLPDGTRQNLFPIYINPIYNDLLMTKPCDKYSLAGRAATARRSQSEHVSWFAGSSRLEFLHHVL